MPRSSPPVIPALRLCPPPGVVAPSVAAEAQPAVEPSQPGLRRPRDARPETIYRVERQIVPGRCLTPAADLFVQTLHRLIERRPIELFGFALHTRGYSLLIRALDDRLSAALRDLHSQLARQLNARQGTHGALWAGRVTYRSMRHHAESVAALVDILVEPVLRGAADHPSEGWPANSHATLVRRGVGVARRALRPTRLGAPPCAALPPSALPHSVSPHSVSPHSLLPHTALPWFGTMDASAVADRLDGAVEARLAAARAWALAG